ncbi:MAG: hypothetical protein ACI9AT_000268 [Ulvibacter sp.]|jgi:hypothetical protein
MRMKKKDLVEFLIGFIGGDSECAKKMEAAYKRSQPIWEREEWIYVKDVEMSLKGIHKTLETSGFSSLHQVGEFILSGKDEKSVENNWVRERIADCRRSLSELDFPHPIG